MTRSRSPSYPNQPLQKAIELISNVFQQDRRNPIDRLTAVKHLGYSGNSGAADKTLATMAQYGLLEKSGVGEVQVSELAVEILHPETDLSRKKAISEAATRPAVFSQILERFPDHTPSKSALESWLVREEFHDRAIGAITRSFLDTVRYLEQEGAHDVSRGGEFEAETSQVDSREIGGESEFELVPQAQKVDLAGETKVSPTERNLSRAGPQEWFRVQVGKERTLTINLIGSGDIEPKDIDKLIRMLEVQKLALED